MSDSDKALAPTGMAESESKPAGVVARVRTLLTSPASPLDEIDREFISTLTTSADCEQATRDLALILDIVKKLAEFYNLTDGHHPIWEKGQQTRIRMEEREAKKRASGDYFTEKADKDAAEKVNAIFDECVVDPPPPLTDESLECLEDRGVAGMAADAGVDAADADDAPATEGDVWDALFADEPAMVMDDDDVA